MAAPLQAVIALADHGIQDLTALKDSCTALNQEFEQPRGIQGLLGFLMGMEQRLNARLDRIELRLNSMEESNAQGRYEDRAENLLS